MSHRQPTEELTTDKRHFVAKYRLVPKQINNKLYWVREFQNRPDHPYASHKALRKCHIIELVFSVYDLCVAKMTYFKKNIRAYTPCKMDFQNRTLQPCALWDMEFLVQNQTGIPIDLRNLAEIRDIEVFRALCRWLEDQQLESSLREAEFCQPLLAI